MQNNAWTEMLTFLEECFWYYVYYNMYVKYVWRPIKIAWMSEKTKKQKKKTEWKTAFLVASHY